MRGATKKKAKRPSETRRAKSAGWRIIESLTEIHDAVRSGRPLGESLTVREVEVAGPAPHNANSVREIRAELQASQTVFAQLLGVSTKLVQSWEIGSRTPSPLARRLLDEMKRDPRRWRGLLRRSA